MESFGEVELFVVAAVVPSMPAGTASVEEVASLSSARSSESGLVSIVTPI